MRLLQGIFVLMVACANAFGWGCEGHQIVALIAGRHLTPEARTGVYELLKDNPADPALSRFCKPLAPDAMADAATWGDDIKKSAKNDPWHYVDIPRNLQHGDLMAYCKANGDSPGCVVTALEKEFDILKDRSRPAAERADAVRYLIHFLGDMHQPLHTSDDVGGNCISVQVADQAKPSNLHAAWDYGILQPFLKQNNETPPEMAEKLDHDFHSKGRHWLHDPIDFTAWIWETHHLVDKVTYGKLAPKPENTPAEGFGPACDAERGATAALHIRIDGRYSAAVMPVIQKQLAKAGYRLADVLNAAFTTKP